MFPLFLMQITQVLTEKLDFLISEASKGAGALHGHGTSSRRCQIEEQPTVYNGVNDKSTQDVNNMFTYVPESHDVNTRASSNSSVKMPKYCLTKTQGNLRHRGAQYFNKLPSHVKNANTIAAFQSNVKSFYIARPVHR